jgi:hypothetical protein
MASGTTGNKMQQRYSAFLNMTNNRGDMATFNWLIKFSFASSFAGSFAETPTSANNITTEYQSLAQINISLLCNSSLQKPLINHLHY